jgi:glycosyltransferase involved in cell wall biosynthesis
MAAQTPPARSRPRVAVVANCPLPYHTPILNRLARRVDLRVIYMSRRHPLADIADGSGAYDDPWGEPPEFRHEFHRSAAIRLRRSDFRTQVSVGVSARLERARPDVVLFSSWGPLMLEPLAWRLVRGRRAVMWAESTAWSGLLRGRASRLARRLLLGRVDAFVANGSQAAAFLSQMGVADDRVVVSCLPSALHVRPVSVQASTSPCVRRFLFVGRLIDRKRPLEVIAAFTGLLDSVPGAHLTVVGDGPLMEAARRAAERAGEAITFTGRREGAALAETIVAADALVVSSVREVWGLVVNEALGAGLFVIATDQVASAADLIDEASGVVVAADDAQALRDALVAAAQGVAADAAARAARAERVRHCTPDGFAAAIERAVHVALEVKA